MVQLVDRWYESRKVGLKKKRLNTNHHVLTGL